MTEEQKRLYDGNASIAAAKRTGVKWLSDDIRKLAKSSLEVSKQFAADFEYVRGIKKELPRGVKYTQPSKQDSKQLLELLDALNFSSKRKMGAVKLHALENVNSISAIKKIALAAQKRKLKAEAEEEARLRKERAAAAAAQQKVKIKLATDFLNAGNFGGAMRACREAIEGNPECAQAHYLLFLADNNLKNTQMFESGKNTYLHHFDELYEAFNYADDEEVAAYLDSFAKRVKTFEEFNAFKEYQNIASQYDDDSGDFSEIRDQIYASIMRDKYDLNKAMEYFDELIRYMDPQDDIYVDFNVNFGDKVLAKNPAQAEKYYLNAVDCHDDNEEAQYKLFLAQSRVRSTTELLQKVGTDFNQMDKTVFSKGGNAYAVNEICTCCLNSNGTSLLSADPLFEYIIEKIPKSKTKTAVSNLCAYAEKLIDAGHFDIAKKHNEHALRLNKDCHEAHFNRMLINKQIRNPLELVDYAANIFDDPDFYAATSAYALLNKNGNIYIDIGDALVRADKKLKDSKCRKYVLKNCKLKRADLAKCDTKINSAITEYNKQEEERKKRERERRQREEEEARRRERDRLAAAALKRGKKKALTKAWLIAIPEIILGAILLAAYFNPMLIFQFIHFGILVGVTVVLCLVMFIIGCKHYSGYYEHRMKARGFRGFLSVSGYVVCFALMLTCVLQPKTIEINNARQLYATRNLCYSTHYSYVLNADVDLKDYEEFKPIEQLYSNCTFDGNGHVIKNMKIRRCSYRNTQAGMIADNFGTIKNVVFEDCSVFMGKGTYTNRDDLRIGIPCGRGGYDSYASKAEGRLDNVKLVRCSVSTHTKNPASGITMFGCKLKSTNGCSAEDCELQGQPYNSPAES